MSIGAHHTHPGSSQGAEPLILLWELSPSLVLSLVAAEGDLWFSAKSLVELLSVTKQNISIHLLDLQCSGMETNERLFPIRRREGQRVLVRKLKHYPFDIAHAVALRTKNYEVLNHLVDLASTHGLQRRAYKIAPVKERDFAALLVGSLDGITKVIKQHRVGGYLVDFYLPAEGLVVEYDEHHHAKPRQQARDNQREASIATELGADFIRVKQGSEIAGLNQILRRVFSFLRCRV